MGIILIKQKMGIILLKKMGIILLKKKWALSCWKKMGVILLKKNGHYEDKAQSIAPCPGNAHLFLSG